MTVGDIKALLDGYPDDMDVGVVEAVDGELNTDVNVSEAVNHPGSRPHGGKSWHWKTDPVAATGTPVLVFH